jgi:hypothetical protein
MDKDVAEILAAAINNMAAATALQAETNAVLAGEVTGLKRTIQAQQAMVDRKVKPLIERSQAAQLKIKTRLEGPPDVSGS